MTVGEYLGEWLDGKRSLRPSTYLSYSSHVRLYLVPHIGEVRLVDLAPQHLEVMYRAIAADNASRTRPVGMATLQRIHATVMSALSTAVRRGLLARNPAETVELPTPARFTVPAWRAAEFAGFIEAIVDEPLYPLYLLLGLTGLRRGEAVGLRWVDVDEAQGCLRVRQQVVVVNGELVVGEPKTTAGHRVVALDAATVRLLHCHRCTQQLHHRDTGQPWSEADLVFTAPDGGPLDPAYVSRHFDRLVAKHGLPRIRLHDLRHTSASMGLASGESLLEVSRRLGHSSITVTADVYSHLSPVVARESAERLSKHIFHS